MPLRRETAPGPLPVADGAAIGDSAADEKVAEGGILHVARLRRRCGVGIEFDELTAAVPVPELAEHNSARVVD